MKWQVSKDYTISYSPITILSEQVAFGSTSGSRAVAMAAASGELWRVMGISSKMSFRLTPLARSFSKVRLSTPSFLAASAKVSFRVTALKGRLPEPMPCGSYTMQMQRLMLSW